MKKFDKIFEKLLEFYPKIGPWPANTEHKLSFSAIPNCPIFTIRPTLHTVIIPHLTVPPATRPPFWNPGRRSRDGKPGRNSRHGGRATSWEVKPRLRGRRWKVNPG